MYSLSPHHQEIDSGLTHKRQIPYSQSSKKEILINSLGKEVFLYFAEYLGLIAGLLVTCSLIPQIIRVFRLKSAREISAVFTVLLLLGLVLWVVYGIILTLAPVIIWNAIGAVLAILLLYAKIRYGHNEIQ